MRSHAWLLIILAALLLWAGCANQETLTGSGSVRLLLTDQAGPFDQVLVTIKEVDIHSPGAGWQTLATKDDVDQFVVQPIDLLSLRNIEKVIAAPALPAGTYTQMRVVLDPGATVVVDEHSHPLKVPSGEQTGLKTPAFTISSGTVTYVVVDIQTDRILAPQKAGSPYILPPTAVSATAYTGPFGALSGTVAPSSSQAVVTAFYDGTDKAAGSATVDPISGSYTIAGLLPGDYYVKAAADGFQPFDSRPTLYAVTGSGTTAVPAITLNPVP